MQRPSQFILVFQVVKMNSGACAFFLLSLVSVILAGPDDKISQLEMGFTNIDMMKVYNMAEVDVEFGQVGHWLN